MYFIRSETLKMNTNPGILFAILLSVLSQNVHAACNGETPPLPLPGGTEKVAITVSDPNLGDVERTFDLHLPAGYSVGSGRRTPLWLDFHGAGAVIGDSSRLKYRRVST